MSKWMGGFLLITLLGTTTWAENYVDEPSGCYHKKKFPCSIQVMGATFDHNEEKLQISLTKNSALTFNKDLSLKLLSGSMWIIAPEFKVLMPFATITGSGESLFVSTREKSWISNLDADLKISGINESVQPFLLKGTKLWLGSLASDNHQSQGMLEVIEAKEIVETASVHNFSKKKVKGKLDHWKPVWAESKTQLSDIYKEVAQRKISSVEESDRLKAWARRKVQLENQELKRLFRQKNFVD